jgi:hypothetical protein
MRFWFFETWQSSLTLVDFPDSCRLPGFLVSWTLHGLVVFYASCCLPDSLGLQTLKAVAFILKTFTSFKGEPVNRHLYTC